MVRRLFNIVTALSLLLCVATILLWARSLQKTTAVEFIRHGKLWEVASRAGRLSVDNEPQRQLEVAQQRPLVELRRTQRSEVDFLLSRIDRELHPRIVAVYLKVRHEKIGQIDVESVNDFQKIQVIKNAILSRIAELGYVPLIWELDFETHTDNEILVQNMYVVRDKHGIPAFLKVPPSLPALTASSSRSVSYRLLLGVAASPALLELTILVVRRVVVRNRRRSCRCTVCGYDLRATPDRCPECGTAVKRVPTT